MSDAARLEVSLVEGRLGCDRKAESSADSPVDPLHAPCPLAASTLSPSCVNVLYYGLSVRFCRLTFSLPFYAFPPPHPRYSLSKSSMSSFIFYKEITNRRIREGLFFKPLDVKQ